MIGILIEVLRNKATFRFVLLLVFKRVWRDNQQHDIDVLVRTLVSGAQCIISTGKSPDADLNIFYDDDDKYSRG